MTAVGDDTALAGIQRLVSEAQQSNSRAQVLADRFAAWLFYVATGSAIITFVAWTFAGNRKQAVISTVTVLVIACPHALGLTIPLVISLSTAVAARNGILVKDRLALERMRKVTAVLFDKTSWWAATDRGWSLVLRTSHRWSRRIGRHPVGDGLDRVCGDERADEFAIVQRLCGLGDRDVARGGPAALGAGRPFAIRMAPSVRIRAPVSIKSAPRAVRAGRGAPRWGIVRVVVLSRRAAVQVRTCPGPTSAALFRLCDPGTIVQRTIVAACYSQ